MHQRAALRLSLFPFALALFQPLAAQTEILRVVAPSTASDFGFEVATLGDVDGDGKDDFAVASRGDSAAGSGNTSIRVHSGATGAELYMVAVPPNGLAGLLGFGNMLAATGDVDGDGIGDFIHGSIAVGGTARGAAYVRSGADGSLMRTVDPARDPRLRSIGSSVSGYADVDGDGLPEVLIGAPSSVNPGLVVGAVIVYSPAHDTIVRAVFGTAWGPFGDRVAAAGDVDGDGFEDIAVTWTPAGQTFQRRAILVSGRTGGRIRELSSAQGISALAGLGDYDGDGDADLYLPSRSEIAILDGPTGVELDVLPAGSAAARMLPVGDQDGGGLPDFLVGDHIGTRGSFAVYARETGKVLLRLVGDPTNSSSFGRAVDRIGDLDGDGREDFVVADAGANPPRVSVFGWDGVTRASAVGMKVGSSCPGFTGATPAHGVSPRPVLGTSIDFGLSNAPRSVNVVLNLGLPARIDLTRFGAPDCVLRVTSPSISLPGVTSTQGFWSVDDVQVPTQASFEGLVLNSQVLLLVPFSNSLGVITSNGWQLQLGR